MSWQGMSVQHGRSVTETDHIIQSVRDILGTYALGPWGGGGGNRTAGTMLSGSQLNFSTCEGELTGGNMAGTWKLLGALVGEGDYSVWNTSLFIRVA